MSTKEIDLAIGKACGFDAAFSSDLNACHEMEKMLKGGMRSKYDAELTIISARDHCFIWETTAAQKCEAFLQTLNLRHPAPAVITLGFVGIAALRAARERKGLSLRECATRLKLSAPYLSDVELGRRGMTDGNLEVLMGIVGPPTMQDRFEAITRATKTPIADNGTRIKS